MITREEALKSEPLVTPNGYYSKVYKTSEYKAIINLIFDQQEVLRQHIKDLESQLSSNPLQLNCDGCYYYDKYEHFNYCDGCTRHSDAGSFAELKDKFTKDTK